MISGVNRTKLAEVTLGALSTIGIDGKIVGWNVVSGVNRAKIAEVTLRALRTRQSLVKGERLVRHEMRAVMNFARWYLKGSTFGSPPCGFRSAWGRVYSVLGLSAYIEGRDGLAARMLGVGNRILDFTLLCKG